MTRSIEDSHLYGALKHWNYNEWEQLLDTERSQRKREKIARVIVMEEMKGRTLKDLISDGYFKLTDPEARKKCMKLLEAKSMQAVGVLNEELGVYHGDLNCGNILFQTNHNGEVVRVCFIDFARARLDSDVNTKYTDDPSFKCFMHKALKADDLGIVKSFLEILPILQKHRLSSIEEAFEYLAKNYKRKEYTDTVLGFISEKVCEKVCEIEKRERDFDL